MGVLKSILLIVYLFPFESNGQFRIVGLLNVENVKSDRAKVSEYHSNAQGRGFSVDEGLKKFLIRPKNIIRVHLIDEIQQSDLISKANKILMVQTQKPAAQHTTEKKSDVSKKTGKIAKRTLFQCIPRKHFFKLQTKCINQSRDFNSIYS